jgi:cytochrome P450
MSTFGDVVAAIVDEIRSRPEPGGLVGALVDRGVEEDRLHDHVGTFILAGYETTAATLTWALYLTARDGSVQERLRRDDPSDAALADPSSDPPPGDTQRVVMESMRLFPPIPYVVREVDRDVEVDGYGLAAGEQLLVPQIVTHRASEIWDDPMAFDPDRFDGTVDRPSFSFYPFGGGPRICIGRPLALLEATTVLSRVVEAFELEDATGVEPSDMGLDTAITMFPDRPVRLSLTERG